MPFDEVGFFSSEYLRKIDAVIDLIGTSERWGKGSFRTLDGRYCLRGAIRALDPSEALGPVILDAINQVAWRHYRHIERFNDSPWTNHKLVLAALRRARDDIAAGRFGTMQARAPRPTLFGRWWNRVTARFDQSAEPVGAIDLQGRVHSIHTADNRKETVPASLESVR